MDGDDDFKELRGRRRRRRRRGPEEESEAAGGGPGQAVAQEGPGEPDQAPTAAAAAGEAAGRAWCRSDQDLSGLQAAQRHRCLGEVERLHLASAGNSPECPFCGKGFGALGTRDSHLKCCVARAAVPPPLLLQVVQQQNSGLPDSLSGLKRKVSSFTEQATKKRKTRTRMGDAEEDLLVAMAMSRSLHEEAKARLLTSGRMNRANQGRKYPKAEKKNHAVASHSPPRLLLQDPEKTRRQMEERMALLLSEVEESPSTPLLPPSQLLELELTWKADRPLALPRGPLSTLWECSSLGGLSDPESVCVAGSTPPALPGQTNQRPTQSIVLPFGASVRAETEDSPWEERAEDAQEGSQKEAGALRDLMLLAGEGLTLTQWSLAAQPVEEPGREWAPSDSLRSNPSQSLEKKLPAGSCTPSVLLGSLATAFKGMVNNPHLSDVQFQVDSGELFYAHMFVLYARCPQLMEMVDQKGFLVAEEGGMKMPRVLLNDVSGDAVVTFFNYLYTAETVIPPQALSDVTALATRFGVVELAALCASHSWCGQPAVDASEQEEEESGQEEEERVEKFEELLKSIWMGEEREDRALLPEELGSENLVDEQELEEIYEFAATQRKAEEGRCSFERNCVEPEAGAAPGDSSEWEGHLDVEPSHLQVQGARKMAGPSLLDPEEQRPLGAASGRHPAALLELAEASRELDKNILQSGSWGESSQLFQQSCSGKDLSDDDDDAMKPFTLLGPEKQLLPVCRNFSSGDSQISLVVPAGKCPTSPKRSRGIGSDLSLSLFSPTSLEASGGSCRSEEQELPELQRGGASSGVPAGSGPDHTQHAAAPLPPISSSCSVDVQGDLMLIPGAEGERRCGQRKLQAEVMGSLSKEEETSGAVKRPLFLGVDIPCRQDTRLGSLPFGEAGAGSRKRLSPVTPLLSHRGPDHEQMAKPGLASSPEAQDSLPAQEPAIVASPKRQPLRACLPGGLRSPSPGGGKAVCDVVIVEDSEEEGEAAPLLTWDSCVLEASLPLSEDDTSVVTPKAGGCQLSSSPRSLLTMDGMLPGGSGTTGPLPHFGHGEEERGSRRQRFQDQCDVSEVLPLSQRLAGLSSACSQDPCRSARGCLPAPVPVHKTPDLACQEREVPHTTPPTPISSYSMMETPELKKELRRFGVRALPKKKMVLKLKEIFHYTHQRPDSRDEATTSQPLLCQGAKATHQRPASAAASSAFPKQQPSFPGLPQVLQAGGGFRGSCGADHQGGQMGKQDICLLAGSGRLKSSMEDPVRGGQALAPCPKEDGLSRADGDTSVILQSSSTEFETSMQTEEEEEEEDISSSQSSCHEADTLEALRQFIHSRPALCCQILLYEPFELTGLQSELKQNGIRIALGRLLKFLDTHCITFTTAEKRREKRQRTGRRGRGRY